MDDFLEIGKIQPQAVELEEAVLGAMMLEQGAVYSVIDLLIPEVFYKPIHQTIFSAIYRLFQKSHPIDIMTVTQELKDSNELEMVGGAYAVTMLTDRIATATNIEFHTRVLLEKYMGRSLIDAASRGISKIYQNEDVFDVLDNLFVKLMKINDVTGIKQSKIASKIWEEEFDKIQKIRSGEIKDGSIKSPLSNLNKITNGFVAPDLFILAARPSMGKTAFVVSVIIGIAMQGIPVGVFSLEMSKEQLVKRVAAQLTGITYSKIDQPTTLSEIEFSQVQAVREKINELPIYIDDTPAINVVQLRSKATDLKARYGVKILFLDYLQLMSGLPERKSSKREEEVSSFSRALKETAKALNVPFIGLSQLNRSLESRGDKRPMLSDLRESGAIEQDADIVGFLYRPIYYNLKDVPGISEDDIEEYAELIIAKHRNGDTGTIELRFQGKIMKYSDFVKNTTENPAAGMVPDVGYEEGDIPF